MNFMLLESHLRKNYIKFRMISEDVLIHSYILKNNISKVKNCKIRCK